MVVCCITEWLWLAGVDIEVFVAEYMLFISGVHCEAPFIEPFVLVFGVFKEVLLVVLVKGGIVRHVLKHIALAGH